MLLEGSIQMVRGRGYPPALFFWTLFFPRFNIMRMNSAELGWPRFSSL